MSLMKLLFVRHGENENNLLGDAGFFENDFPLTANGKEQSLNAALLCKQYNPVKIYTSNYLRAWQTAEIIAGECDGIPIESTPMLREINQGQWGGLKSGEITRLLKEMGLWEWGPRTYEWKAPDGESFKDVMERSRSFVESVADKSDSTVVFVTHSGTLKVLMSWLQARSLGETLPIQYPNAAVSGFRMSDGIIHELFVNRV